MKHYELEAPAELVITPLRYGKYEWSVCQPDACWGEYYGGVADSKQDALKIGSNYLNVVHKKQGY